MPLPQSEPATCPGKTSTPSGSSSSRRSEWKSPSAPSFAPTARSGRAASPTKSESPVSTSQGSSARVRSMTARHVCSGRCPGVWIARRTTWPSSSSTPSSSEVVRILGLCRAVDRDRNAVLEREPAVAGEMVGVRVRLDARTISTSRLAAASSTGSIAYGGSTIAATPASSSPTRYDAQPRSSSRNCWNSTRCDAITPSGGGRGGAGRARARAPGTSPATAIAQGNDDASGAGTTVSAVVHLDGLAARVHGAQDQRHLARRRVGAHPHAPDRLRPLPALQPGRQDLDPGALDLDPRRRRTGAQTRQFDPQLGDFTLLDEARLHVDMRPCTLCRHEDEKRR